MENPNIEIIEDILNCNKELQHTLASIDEMLMETRNKINAMDKKIANRKEK